MVDQKKKVTAKPAAKKTAVNAKAGTKKKSTDADINIREMTAALLRKLAKKISENPEGQKRQPVQKIKKIVKRPAKPKTEPKEKPEKQNKGIRYLGGLLLSKMARGGALALRSNAEEVNKLNVFPVPDGDTGDNMSMTIESGVAAIENLNTDDLAEVMKMLSHGMLLGARGNSGVILSQFFAGTAKGFEGVEQADANALGHALELGVEQAYASVMTPTEGTILTVAREAVAYAVKRITPASTIGSFFADLVDEMHASLDRTPEILTVLKEAGVVDSGGAGLLYIMDGFNRVLNGEDMEKGRALPTPAAAAISPADLDAFTPDSEMTFGYCTELLVRLQNKKTDVENFDIEPIKEFLMGVGDSVVVFKTGSALKLHVHTFTPEKVLEYCRTCGEFLTVKIENMSVQHTANEAEQGTAPVAKPAPVSTDAPKKKYAVVTVSNGDGIEALFREIGADEIVQGGQTQNPSTNDFLDAFGRINAEHIFVLPNNGNILMAAQQAGELWENAQVHVIPSKNIGTGYVALSSVDFENCDTEQIIETMMEAMKNVTAGYVSPSIRDAEISGVHINKGDTIGIIEKEIVVSEPEKMTAACALTDKLTDSGDKFMLTVFCGEDSSEEENAILQKHMEENHPEVELCFIEGGQAIYPYIFVAE